MTDEVRDRLYAAYSSGHAGVADPGAERRAYLRDIKPHLPADSSISVVDLGCGQGQLVKQLIQDGYASASGIDVSPEQVERAHANGVDSVRLGDFRELFTGATFDVVTATDFFEHLTRAEVLGALDSVIGALAPGGRLIARLPNAVSPFGGNFQHGDLTHETAFTPWSFRQASRAAGFDTLEAFECPPFVHSAKSFVRRQCWRMASGVMKAALAVETGPMRGHFVTQNFVAVAQKKSR